MTLTYRDRVAEHFKAHPREKISAYTLMEIGGRMAWRTRISECRRDLGMDIPPPTITRDQHGVATSWYKFIPSAEPSQPSMFQQGHV